MPAHAPATDNALDLLKGYITQQLGGIRNAAYGLTDEQLRLTPTISSLSVGALVKHVTACTSGWLDRADAAPAVPTFSADEGEYGADFQLTDADDGATLRANLEAVMSRVENLSVDLDERVPVPTDAPWWPQDVESWSVTWVLLHLVEEIARHAGHADIIREAVDGATMYELLAGAEGWPDTGWLRPWTPAADSVTGAEHASA